jgi:hypothetical protein
MQVEKITTPNGIHDIKLIGENEEENQFIKQLANAGTLSCLDRQVSNTVSFRAISVSSDISSYSSTKNSIGKYDFVLRQNQEQNIDLSFRNSQGTIDLTQFPVIKLQVKHTKSAPAIIELSLNEGLLISGENKNILKVAFSSDQTKLLASEVYYYDILTATDNSNRYYLEGKITIKKTGTR